MCKLPKTFVHPFGFLLDDDTRLSMQQVNKSLVLLTFHLLANSSSWHVIFCLDKLRTIYEDKGSGNTLFHPIEYL